ncbi:MAG: hypothetical protein Kow0091_00090 [Geminocystis sp.]
MSYLKPLAKTEVSDQAQEILTEIENQFGMIPNLFKTYAYYPPLLKANWQKFRATMEGGTLSPKLKQTIAVLISLDNSTEYCVCAHSRALLNMGISEEELKNIRRGNLSYVGFTRPEITLINLMRQVNKNANNVSEYLFQEIKNQGISDTQLVEAYGVMETFLSFNKFLDSLQVEIDIT